MDRPARKVAVVLVETLADPRCYSERQVRRAYWIAYHVHARLQGKRKLILCEPPEPWGDRESG